MNTDRVLLMIDNLLTLYISGDVTAVRTLRAIKRLLERMEDDYTEIV